MDQSTRTAQECDPRSRRPWLGIVADTGRRLADPHAAVDPLADRLGDLTRTLSHEDRPGLDWPVYGALISDLPAVVEIVDDVASREPVRT